MTTATAIDEGPILFTGPLVEKILADHKTEARRVVDPKLWPMIEEIEKVNGKLAWQCADFDLNCRYDHEQLWVQETHRFVEEESGVDRIEYRADEFRRDIPNTPEAGDYVVGNFDKWRSSRIMPRWASRIDLKVEKIILQRLHDMRPEDALAEGIEMSGCSISAPFNAMDGFRRLWDKINGRKPGRAWKDNPFVWCIRFARI